MRRETQWVLSISAAVAVLFLGTAAAHAEAMDGTWVNAVGFGDGPIADADTNHPIVGEDPDDPEFNSNWAEQEMIHSPFTEITLTNPGDKIIFTGNVELSGTTNSPSSSGTPRTQYRFGLFDNNDSANNTGWTGYYMSNRHGDPGTPSGVLASKPVGNTSVYLSVTGQTVFASAQGDGTAASLFNDDTYSMNLTIERNALGELLLSASLTGLNGYTHILNGTDPDAATLGTYTFDTFGFLLGGNLDTDRAAFSDMEVNFVPGGAGTPGDHNGDGIVDAADYALWRSDPLSYGGAQGYTDWVDNFGVSGGNAAGGASLTAVPEPAAWVLLSIVSALLMTVRRRPAPVDPVRCSS